MNYPWVKDADVTGKKILVRVDLDVPSANNPRVDSVEKIISWLKEKNVASIRAIGHRGEYPIVEDLRKEHPDVEWSDGLRDDPREKTNSDDFAKELAEGFGVYINEAFAVSHRNHCSVVALPKAVRASGGQTFLGLRFEEEINNLSKVFGNSGVKVLIIGGAKAVDKAAYAVELASKFDKVLVGGMLPDQIKDSNSSLPGNMLLAKLRDDGLDLDEETINLFQSSLLGAGVVVVAGPMGKFEDVASETGTKLILNRVVESGAFKLAGGGNTEDALEKFGLTNKFDWVSVGGGAMLEFLAKNTLPGIEAVL